MLVALITDIKGLDSVISPSPSHIFPWLWKALLVIFPTDWTEKLMGITGSFVAGVCVYNNIAKTPNRYYHIASISCSISLQPYKWR